MFSMVVWGCGAAVNDPAQIVEGYLQAKVAGQHDVIRNLLCSAMEVELEGEIMSFSGVDARIESMQCQFESGAGVVTCSGKIIAVYDGENTEFPLGRYKVVEEGGQWKWCGEL
jgi:hypothetical protein